MRALAWHGKHVEESAVYEALMEMTGGIGPDAVIDSLGLEAHGFFRRLSSTRSRHRPSSARTGRT